MSDSVLTDVTQIVVAIGVIINAISSIANRVSLYRANKKLDTVAKVAVTAVTVAAETRDEQKIAHADVVDKVMAVETAALAVNAEVVQKVHDVAIEAGKAIASNGHSPP